MSTAIVYARFSSNNQREESIHAQLRACHDYANKNNISILEEYTDEALSGTSDDRPSFLQMFRDVSNGKIKADLLLVHKLDRFARNRLDSAIYKQKLLDKGTKLIAVEHPLTDSPEDSLLEGLLESMNEFYSKNLSRETKKGLRENFHNGKHWAGIPPLGYDVNDEGQYIINEKEAEIVRMVFKMVKDGQTYRGIAEHMKSLGIKSKKNHNFNGASIHDLLKNTKYCGTLITGKFTKDKVKNIIERQGAIPAIIEPEIWKEMQSMLEQRKQTYPKQREGGQIFFLTGKIICGECHSPYSGNSSNGGRDGNHKYSSYNCTGKKKYNCTNKNIRKEVLENYVLDQIENFFQEDKIAEMIQKVMDRYQDQYKKSEFEANQINTNIEIISKKIINLLESIESGLEPRIIAERLNALQKEKDTLQARLKEVSINVTTTITPDIILAHIIKVRETLENRNNPQECKLLIDTYIQEVILFKEDIKITIKIPPKYERKVYDKLVVPAVSIRSTRPGNISDGWVNKKE